MWGKVGMDDNCTGKLLDLKENTGFLRPNLFLCCLFPCLSSPFNRNPMVGLASQFLICKNKTIICMAYDDPAATTYPALVSMPTALSRAIRRQEKGRAWGGPHHARHSTSSGNRTRKARPGNWPVICDLLDDLWDQF